MFVKLDLSHIKEFPDSQLNQIKDFVARRLKKPVTASSHHHKRHRCTLCSTEFPTEKALQHHEVEDHADQRPFCCTVCGLTFASQKNAERHRKALHSEAETILPDDDGYDVTASPFENDTADAKIECNICDMKFPDMARYATHINRHKRFKKLKCDICGHTLTTRSALNAHLRTHQQLERKPHECLMCHRRFSQVWTLSKHEKEHAGQTMLCDLCGEVRDFVGYRKHVKTEHGERPPPVECPVCGKKFRDRYRLQGHSKIHSGVKPFQCDFCEKAFVRKDNLLAHRLVHTGERPHVCGLCSRPFSTKGGLALHLASVHEDENVLRCPLCPKAFRTKLGFDRHMEKAHPGGADGQEALMAARKTRRKRRPPGPHKRPSERAKCADCGKQFNSYVNLYQHQRIHSDARPFICDVCNASFRRKDHLAGHYRTHTGERPFRCDACDKTFPAQGTLWRHKQSVHKSIGQPAMVHPCPTCGRKFSSESGLLIHTQRLHPTPAAAADVDTCETVELTIVESICP